MEEARRQDLAGATVYRGIEGYGASSRIHRKHLLTSSDLPVMVCIIDDAPRRSTAFLPTLERMVSEGLIAISDVEVIRYTHRKRTIGMATRRDDLARRGAAAASPRLNENHRRHLLASCQYIDRLLSDIDNIVTATESASPFARYAATCRPR